jgi:ureidoglycolate dehydrogenase (NAD+)
MGRALSSSAAMSEAELSALGERAFQGLGLTAADAQDVVRILVLADLFGLSTHGLSRIESYGERLLVKGIKARPQITVERVAPAMVRIDGDNGVGPVVGMRALNAAMDAARECGIGIALARGSNHFGPISP